MTLFEFYSLQGELMSVFGWFIRWWLIAFLAGVLFATVLTWMIVTARVMISKI